MEVGGQAAVGPVQVIHPPPPHHSTVSGVNCRLCLWFLIYSNFNIHIKEAIEVLCLPPFSVLDHFHTLLVHFLGVWSTTLSTGKFKRIWGEVPALQGLL